jgi:hypothetical protein
MAARPRDAVKIDQDVFECEDGQLFIGLFGPFCTECIKCKAGGPANQNPIGSTSSNKENLRLKPREMVRGSSVSDIR